MKNATNEAHRAQARALRDAARTHHEAVEAAMLAAGAQRYVVTYRGATNWQERTFETLAWCESGAMAMCEERNSSRHALRAAVKA